jgi:transposase
MRGEPKRQKSMLLLVDPESMVPSGHPLREIRKLTEPVLKELSPVFDSMYSRIGRCSIPPERLLSAMILMALYSIRSERLFCEQLSYNMLFRWFLGMDLEEPSFDHSTFSANRERLMEHEVAAKFFQAVVSQAKSRHLMSDEHFTVDGTLIEAWASLKSFKRKDHQGNDRPPDDPGNAAVDFHGEKRSNSTHRSTTDPEARLYRKGKGKEAKLCYSLNSLMENRHGLLANVRLEEADGFAERASAMVMVDESLPGQGRVTLGADKAYDSSDFVEACRERNVTAHVAQNESGNRSSAIDGRTTRHSGYAVSQQRRKRVEEIFGWMKTVALFAKTRYKGKAKTQFWAHLVGAAYNILRISKLAAAMG